VNVVEISNTINDAVSILKTALNSVEGLLAVLVALVLTANKLAGLLASKKSLLVESPPETGSYT
jgi:hypothetical protein